MIQKILCPTDLTVNSADSIAYGLSLAKENGAQLIVFHKTSFPCLTHYPCYELEPFCHQWDQLISKFKVDHVLAEAERKVKNFLYTKSRAASDGNAWKIRVALGKVTEEIVTAALQEEADIIVLARRNKSPLSRFLTRSISAAVSRNAPCPVISIGPSQFIRRSSGWRLAPLEKIVQHS